MLQRCPDEPTDRLTVLIPDGAEADKPQEEFSVPLTASNATLVAASDDRVAVALPDPPRLEVLDRSGIRVGLVGLDVPAADLARPPAVGGVPAVTTDDDRVYWWTGSRHGRAERPRPHAPTGSLPDTLGPAVGYAGELVVPVPAGVAVLAADTGRVDRDPARPRDDPRAPVSRPCRARCCWNSAAPELVALRPSSAEARSPCDSSEQPDQRQATDDRAASARAASVPMRSVRRSTHTWAVTTATTAAST